MNSTGTAADEIPELAGGLNLNNYQVGPEINFPFVFERSRTRTTTILSYKRKNLIKSFIESLDSEPERYGPVGGSRWTDELWNYLYVRDKSITMEDVQRWIKNHGWITTPRNTAFSFAHISSSRGPEDSNSQSSRVSHGAASTVVSDNRGPETVISLGPQETLKKYDRYRKIIMELREGFLQMPELRAGVVYLDPLINVISRNMNRVMKGKRREVALHEALVRQGVNPVQGFKKEPLATTTSNININDPSTTNHQLSSIEEEVDVVL